jgi:lysophospholipase L1-like esterase
MFKTFHIDIIGHSTRILLLYVSICFLGSACGQESDSVPAKKFVPALFFHSNQTVSTKADRFEKEIRAFEFVDSIHFPQRDAILFTGSSSIRLWKSLSNDFKPLPVLNRGFGGATTPEVNYYYDRIVTRYHPSVIVLYTGENDLAFEGSYVDRAINSLKEFVKQTHEKLPLTRIIYISIKPSPARWKFRQTFDQFNERIRAEFADDHQFTFADIRPSMLTKDSLPMPDIYKSDSLHMNQRGYEIWARELKPLVLREYQNYLKTAGRSKK